MTLCGSVHRQNRFNGMSALIIFTTRCPFAGFNHLEGTIPSELGLLTNLLTLSLSTDGLFGTVPTQLCDLTLLQNLDLGMPAYLRSLTCCCLFTYAPSAQRYHCLTVGQNNNLNGTFLPQFGRLSNLSWLSFYINSLSGTIPTELGMMTSLTFLTLGKNIHRCSLHGG